MGTDLQIQRGEEKKKSVRQKSGGNTSASKMKQIKGRRRTIRETPTLFIKNGLFVKKKDTRKTLKARQ